MGPASPLLTPASRSGVVDLCAEIVCDQKGPELGEHKRQTWSEKPGWLVVTCLYDDDKLRDARIVLIAATRTVIANGLAILGVSAPETM